MNSSMFVHNGLRRVDMSRVGLLVARVLVLAWAGFWLWFNIASALGERDGFTQHMVMAAVTLILAGTCWFWPRVGGVLMVAAGIFAAWAFHNSVAFTLLSLPAATIGVILILTRK
jgi:hypothetical protein